jgi:predicted glycoside hydrolase/deacetylase ChbG (UPF0249 family)
MRISIDVGEFNPGAKLMPKHYDTHAAVGVAEAIEEVLERLGENQRGSMTRRDTA